MSKHNLAKKHESKVHDVNGKKPTRSKIALSLGGIFLALLLVYASLKSTVHTLPATDESDAEQYVRRETKSTLSPLLFVGKTASAYRIAHETPDVLDHLYCYCHCDKSIGHITLLSCFTDTHAANCGVCQDEAIDASAMLKKDFSVPEIRRRIDSKYGRV